MRRADEAGGGTHVAGHARHARPEAAIRRRTEAPLIVGVDRDPRLRQMRGRGLEGAGIIVEAVQGEDDRAGAARGAASGATAMPPRPPSSRGSPRAPGPRSAGPAGGATAPSARCPRGDQRSPQKARAMKHSALITGPHSVSSHRRRGQTARGVLEMGPLRWGHCDLAIEIRVERAWNRRRRSRSRIHA